MVSLHFQIEHFSILTTVCAEACLKGDLRGKRSWVAGDGQWSLAAQAILDIQVALPVHCHLAGSCVRPPSQAEPTHRLAQVLCRPGWTAPYRPAAPMARLCLHPFKKQPCPGTYAT